MITTRMTVSEILNEFNKDYVEIIRDRFFGYIKANRKAIMRAQKLKEARNKTSEIVWIPCKGVRKITSTRNNKYRACIKGRFNKNIPGFTSTTYLILNDSMTGGRVVYLMPADKNDKGLIIFAPKFFTEFNDYYGLKYENFEESVDNFMKTDKYFTLYKSDSGNPRYNCQMDMGSDMVGFGTFNEEKSTFYVRHFKTGEELLNARPKGLDSLDPLTIYIAIKGGVKEEDPKPVIELSDKQREMAAAWEAYENGEL